MRALLIGYGKMGRLIYQTLSSLPETEELTVCDTVFEHEIQYIGVRFVPGMEGIHPERYDCVFIATPAETHCKIMEDMIVAGVKNIYVEKPAVMNSEEMARIQSIARDCRIVTGYILRQSQPAISLKKLLEKLPEEGFALESCQVLYQKYMPASLEPRGKEDIGIYEEIVHVWDLLFNFFGLKKAEILHSDSIVEADPERRNRAISAQYTYEMELDGRAFTVEILSSFKARIKRREFQFVYGRENGEKRLVFLHFDNLAGLDEAEIQDEKAKLLWRDSFPSLLKLCCQMREVLRYFTTGDMGHLAGLQESDFINHLLEESLIYPGS